MINCLDGNFDDKVQGESRVKRVAAVVGLVLVLALFLYWFFQPGSSSKEVVPEQERVLYELRFGHNIPVDSAMHQAALRYAKEVARKSQGQVNITVYPEQQLGNDHKMVEMARAGQLDIILTPTAKLSVPVPAMQYADLPFLFPTREDAYDMLDGEPGQILLAKLKDIDLVGVTFWENGFKHFTGNQPLLKPADFEGLKIRTMKSRIIMDQFKAVGAHPVPIDFHATRQALADHVVDGQENPLIAIVSMGFHEVQSDLTLSEHAYLGYAFSMSEKVVETLPLAIQEILVTTAKEITPWQRQETQRREAALIETIRQAGVNVHSLDPEMRHQFAEKTKHIVDKFESVIGTDIISKTQTLLMTKYGANSDQAPVLIGLDTDLAMEAKVSGLAIKRGAMLALEEINAQGGVLGRELALQAFSHNGIPSKGVNNIKKLVAEPNVVAILGGQHGSVVVAEVETVHASEIPFLLPWSAVVKGVEHGLQPSYTFRVSANDRLAAPYIIDQATRNYKKPAIFYENSVWGRGNFKFMSDRLKTQGKQFAYSEAVNRGREDFDQSVDKAIKAGADVVVMVSKALEGHALIHSLAQQSQPLPVVAHWGIVGGEFWDISNHDLDKIDLSVFQTFSFIENPSPQAKQLAKRYIKRFGLESIRDIQAPAAVAHAYDLVHLLAKAIVKADSTERKAVCNALENLPQHQGAVKYYAPAFTSTKHDALGVSDYRLLKFAEDGALVPRQ